jgi:hypothetical protein
MPRGSFFTFWFIERGDYDISWLKHIDNIWSIELDWRNMIFLMESNVCLHTNYSIISSEKIQKSTLFKKYALHYA